MPAAMPVAEAPHTFPTVPPVAQPLPALHAAGVAAAAAPAATAQHAGGVPVFTPGAPATGLPVRTGVPGARELVKEHGYA